MYRYSLIFLAMGAALALSFGCGDDTTESNTPAVFSWPANTGDAVENYANIVEASYLDSLRAAGAMKGAIEAFIAAPSENTLQAAKDAWLASRVPYLQTEVYRFYDGPIDNETDGPEGLLNAWPLDENYIDYVEGDANAGYINGDGPIDAATLEGLNEVGGEANIATGYHAIEFLLWGQDLSDDGPGARPYTDYVVGDGGTAANQDRRAQYLQVVADMLVNHLGGVHGAWTAQGAYRPGFVADTQGSFAKILTGMIVLSGFETGGERLQAALDSGDREDEHSCFSDNTHVDMIEDVRGIKNVWTGAYGQISGVSIRDVVAAVNADLATQLTTQIDTSLAAANAIPLPFEAAIAPGNAAGNEAVASLVTSLRAQEAILFQIFDAFGLSVTIPE